MVYKIELIENEQIILVTWLSNPANSLNLESISELNNILDEIDYITNADKYHNKPVIFQTPPSSPIFSAGADLKLAAKSVLSKDYDSMVETFDQLDRLLIRLCCFNHRTIAKIDGHTIAGGFFVALACDVRIGLNDPKIKIGYTEIEVGLPLISSTFKLVEKKLPNDIGWELTIGKPNQLYSPQDAYNKLKFLDGLCNDKDELDKKCILEALRIHPDSMNAYLNVKQNLLKQMQIDWKNDRDEILSQTKEFVKSPETARRFKAMIATFGKSGEKNSKSKL